MIDSVTAWAARLRQYSTTCRSRTPLPSRKSLRPKAEWQCRIVGSSLRQWLPQVGPRFLQERAVLGPMLELDAEPLLVFTSDVPGLVAAQEILGPEPERAVCLLVEEYDALPRRLADPDCRWHVHVWSFFRPSVHRGFRAWARERYPLPKGSRYWQHSEGTLWGALAGRSVDHLWNWDGKEATLLEEAFIQAIT
jgi:hypothetical protein